MINTIKKDSMVYASLSALRLWGVIMYKPLNNVNYSLRGVGLKFEETFEDDMLISLKYLGDGIYQEVLTGKIIKGSGFDFDCDNCDYQYDNNEFDGPIIAPFPLTYGDYCADYYNGFDNIEILDFDNYLDKLFETKNIINNSDNLIFLDEYGLYNVNEENKERYLKFSDEERIRMIKKTFLLAQKGVSQAKYEINEAENNVNSINLEAYYSRHTQNRVKNS